ncbi:hypothetical protein ACJRO7_026840 [Eucalyptus globulus]|uniref:Uncharacterized protein n=1 Tax=Eucalyptus globulus TaxID=34317 RepID=A0ABD3JRV7_EUCGL
MDDMKAWRWGGTGSNKLTEREGEVDKWRGVGGKEMEPRTGLLRSVDKRQERKKHGNMGRASRWGHNFEGGSGGFVEGRETRVEWWSSQPIV